MINSMRGCVTCDDLWPWPISSRSFGLDLENRVRFVASTVLDGFFSYLAQMITINRGCVACYFLFRIRKFEFLANFWNFSALTLKKNFSVLNWFFPYLAQMITSKRRCVAYNDLWPWPISSRSFGLGLENRVRSVASTVLDGFLPYLIQMITGMRRCVACDDLWPWPISSRSIRPWLWKSCPLCSVYSMGWILFMFSTNDRYYKRVCPVLRFFQNLQIWIFGKFLKIFWPWHWKKNLQFSMDSFHV